MSEQQSKDESSSGGSTTHPLHAKINEFADIILTAGLGPPAVPSERAAVLIREIEEELVKEISTTST
jgi:hypothetical protein